MVRVLPSDIQVQLGRAPTLPALLSYHSPLCNCQSFYTYLVCLCPIGLLSDVGKQKVIEEEKCAMSSERRVFFECFIQVLLGNNVIMISPLFFITVICML
jgi:hypothetical protein